MRLRFLPSWESTTAGTMPHTCLGVCKARGQQVVLPSQRAVLPVEPPAAAACNACLVQLALQAVNGH